MRLWQFELEKILYTQKGFLILLVCMLLKVLTLLLIPEMKDERIMLSQKQYDRYLDQLYGANTMEKAEYIIGEYENCKAVQNMKGTMEEAYRMGELTEEEWQEYCEELDLAYLHENAAKIFSEKAEQFIEQDTKLSKAHYIYEYGWQTVYTILLLPDLFLLSAVLLLTAQCFSAEASSGMLPVLLAARNGRQQLYWTKLSVLLVVSLCGALVSGGLEVAVFAWRGFLNDGGVPLYSITMFAKECPLGVSLRQGYLLNLVVRNCATLLLAGMFYGVSVWMKNTTNVLFTAVCVLVLPLFLAGKMPTLLFFHIGLLCGSRMLMLLGQSGISVLLPIGVTAVYSGVIVWLAYQRYRRGFA